MEIFYEWIPGGLITQDLLSECANLYSTHYGFWSTCSPNSPGKRIHLSPNRLKEWFASKNTSIYMAKCDDKLIGYAIAATVRVPSYGIVSWVTQLVVHADFRRMDVAKTLLFSIWGLSNHFAWGIVSANPYAVRALEKATRRRCSTVRLSRNKRKLLGVGVDNVPYINEHTTILVQNRCSKINTEFYVDHSRLEEMVRSVTTANVPWVIGEIEDGWEWFAFTFHDQEQISLSAQEIDKMITASDHITKQAYSRMQLSNEHAWMRHADKEARLILHYCNLQPGQTVIDFGCGTGRHSIALAKNDLNVIGIDYIDGNLQRAKADAKSTSGVSFVNNDCRSVRLEEADAVICLYDVIGSHADNSENLQILVNISNHLRDGGLALISVMNYEVTAYNAIHEFKFSEHPNKLLDLPASRIMEKTGNVFDPNYYLVDTETQIVYRKEQFLAGESLPIELIVRDRRFRRSEIEDMCRSTSLEVVWSRYVSAGKWETELDCYDDSAKEILLLCKKSQKHSSPSK
ncbi:MAG: bifunctional GNAT family N-acetyltransferase/class I SAM-dependent methyltransferase [Candidatus Nitrotoga sp.]